MSDITKETKSNNASEQVVRLVLLKSSLLAIFFAIIMLLLTAFGVGIFYWNKFEVFAKSANTTTSEIIQIFKKGWNEPIIAESNKKNILILGLDSLENRGDIPPLTDTIILASINTENGKITTLPFPRDLWIEEYQTKINALYYYGKDRFPESPEKFPKEVIANLTSMPIHHTIVISLQQLEEIIDLVGGIKINIPESFTDDQFPRTDVDVTIVRDPKLLYETISFEKGEEIMSGERALKYIRSRHSQGDQGTDLARSQRQQLVIESLSDNLLNIKKYISQPKKLGLLYKYYQENFASQIPITQLISMGKILYPSLSKIEFIKASISTQPDRADGILVNPTPSKKYQNQWVYIISDQERFKDEIQAIFR